MDYATVKAIEAMAALYDDNYPTTKSAKTVLIAQILAEHGLEFSVAGAISVIGNVETACNREIWMHPVSSLS